MTAEEFADKCHAALQQHIESYDGRGRYLISLDWCCAAKFGDCQERQLAVHLLMSTWKCGRSSERARRQ